jgi:hypothetical protein
LGCRLRRSNIASNFKAPFSNGSAPDFTDDFPGLIKKRVACKKFRILLSAAPPAFFAAQYVSWASSTRGSTSSTSACRFHELADRLPAVYGRETCEGSPQVVSPGVWQSRSIEERPDLLFQIGRTETQL